MMRALHAPLYLHIYDGKQPTRHKTIDKIAFNLNILAISVAFLINKYQWFRALIIELSLQLFSNPKI